MKRSIFVWAVLAFIAPMTASAHELFLADVGFEKWERHCHEYEISGTRECWAVFQHCLNNNREHKQGFVVIVHENQRPLSFALRNVNRFGHTIDVKIDDNKTYRLACHASSCTPFEREDAKQLIDQMKVGKKMVLRNNSLADGSRPGEETILLTGFSAALGE